VMRILLPSLLLLASVGGCGGGPKLMKVSGTVTRQGKALPQLLVHFVPDQGRASWGKTDDQGRYTLHYERNLEGALPGSHKVYVRPAPKTPQEEIDLQSGKWIPFPEWAAVQEKYGSLEATKLRFEVKDDGQVIDLKLD